MGPLKGLKVVEFAGIGPAPLCAMLLADLGANVLRIDRITPSNLGRQRPLQFNLPFRNRDAIALDLKDKRDVTAALRLIERSDVLIEGFRPGVMERLGLGPSHCFAHNKALVYGRLTGWGQTGPLAQMAGHDINYVALSGALNAIGRRGSPPTPPLNLVGDYGGGSLYLAFGIMSALYERQASGLGQVVDAAIVDGVSSMLASLFGLNAAGLVTPRGTNPTDSGSHFYNTYECADGKWIALAAVERKFYETFLATAGLTSPPAETQLESSRWPEYQNELAAFFKMKTRDEWCELFSSTDSCVSPVLSLEEASRHPHLVTRGTLTEIEGIVQPTPAPRFSRSTPDIPTPPQQASPHDQTAITRRWLDSHRRDERPAS